ADETAHRELMRLHALAGRRHDALRQYQAAVDSLNAELGVPPAPETFALHQQILAGDLAPPAPPAVPGLQPSAPLPAADPLRPLFVGRAREISGLEDRLEQALGGKGGVIFITGEAGQGKTSLMDEFAHRAQGQHPGLVVAAGACQALAGISDPYLPFRNLIAMLCGDWQRPWLHGTVTAAHAQRLQALAPQTAAAIHSLAPDLLDVLVPAAGTQHRPAETPALQQGQVFEQTRLLLRALAHNQPLLLLLDDLQWIDTASANLLFFLGRQLTDSAVLIVGAYRPSEIDESLASPHPLAPVVQELTRYHGDIRIELSASNPEESRRFVDALLDSEPNRLDASFREALFRRTHGQPLFTVELLRSLQDQGQLVQDSTGRWAAAGDLQWDILPTRVEAVIARRINRLPPDLQQLLSLASVEGELFTVEVLARVQESSARQLIRQLSQELDRRFRLVRELGSLRIGQRTLTRFQFRHNLFQQYLYHQLGPAERQLLHSEIAGVLEQLGADDPGGLAVSIAYHYLAAGDAARAIPYLYRAGDDARRRLALEEAIQFYQSALNHWQAENPPLKAEILRRLGETLLTTGRSRAAIEPLAAAKDIYAHSGNRSGVGAMHRLIGRAYWEQGERASAMQSYQQAFAILEGEPDGAEMARAISAIAQMHVLADEHDQAIEWGERALALAQRLHVPDVAVHAMCTLGSSLVVLGEVDRGLALLTESLAQAESLSLPHDACRALTVLAEAYLILERYPEAQATYERLLAYARKIRAELFEGVALALLGYLYWWTGRWRAALSWRQAIQAWLGASGAPLVSKVWAVTLLGQMHNDLGQPERARDVLTGYRAVARSAGELQTTGPFLGQLARAAASDAERAEIIQEILALVDESPFARYDVLPALMVACGWLAQTTGGDPAALSRLEKAHEFLRTRQSTAALHEVRGFAAGVRGDWALAIADYQVAAASWEALQRPYDRLRVLTALDEASRRAGDTNTSQTVQQAANAVIEQLAGELEEPEWKAAFLQSALAAGMRRH
ncbi:MAG TPA: AAA family ATPase, partial [Anaerolineaceae bacterium]|nr:AAA family ATPase [Anaerolineaceae bacterium]